MTPFQVACEHCDASFRISDASKIGKRVKCPKCAEPFTIRRPADEDDAWDDDGFDEPATRPAKRPAPKKRGGGSRKSSQPDNRPMMLWIGGGAGVVLLLLGLLWAGGMLGGGGAPPTPAIAAQPAAPAPSAVAAPIRGILERLPPSTEVVVHLRLKDAMASPLATGFRTADFDAQMKAPNPLIPGTTISGIETVTMSLSNVTLQVSEQKRLSASGREPQPGSMPLPVEPLVVVTLTDPLTSEFLNFPPENATQHGEKTIFRRPAPLMPGTPPCLSIVEPKVVVLGTEAQLKELLDQESANTTANDFQLLDGQAHLAMAICPRGIVQQVERLAVNNLEIPQLHRELNQFISKGGKTVGLQVSLSSELEVGVIAQASDAAKVADLQPVFEAQVQAAKDSFSAAAGGNPLLASLKPVVDGIQVAVNVDRVSASAMVPPETLQNLGQMALAMAGPMMMNLSPPPAGGPTGPTGPMGP